MKKTTLYLDVDGRSVINFESRIYGDIEPVLKKLGNRVNTRSVLVDISSFRGVRGDFSMSSCDGLLGHTRVLDILSDQSGILLLQPGEVLDFTLTNSFVRFYNLPNENGPYLHHGIFRGQMPKDLAHELKKIRDGVSCSTREN